MNKRKVVWVAWNKVLSSKASGGLETGSFQALNFAFLCKWWWKFKHDQVSLWTEVIKALHGSDGSLGRSRSAAYRSGTWGVISNINSDLNKINVELNDMFLRMDVG